MCEQVDPCIDGESPLAPETPRRADLDNELVLRVLRLTEVVSVLNGLVMNLATWVRTR